MLKKTYRYIIWDWNGTLFDDAWLCVEITNGLLSRRRLPVMDTRRYQAAFTFPVIEYYRRVGFDFTRDSFETLAAEFINEYDQRQYECRLQQNARDILLTLQNRDYTQFILSASEQTRLDEMVTFHGIRPHFRQLVGLSDYYSHGKIDRGAALIRELGHAPAEFLLIGDTCHDYEVATVMGIDCLLIPSGHHSPEQLAATGAPVVGSLAEIDALLT